MSPRRASHKISYTPAGPVTIILPDGSTILEEPLGPAAYRELIAETEPPMRGGWEPVAHPAQRREAPE